jgi:SnoaL-like domain
MTAEDRIAELEQRLGKVEDLLAIRNLQHAYGYYLDKCLYDEVVDLFAEDGEVIFIGGVYKGKKGAARLYAGRFRNNFAGGKNGPTFGRLLDHPIFQDVITVAGDRATAKARFRVLMQAGTHELAATPQTPVRQWFEGGLYENDYVREDGVWKIKKLFYRAFWHGSIEHGWAYTPPDYVPNASVTYPEDPYGPDELLPDAPRLWPDTTTFPFHYRHPVTGQEVT